MAWSGSGTVVVVGQVGRDLVLEVDAIPDAGGSTTVRRRIERLGGKGANQAVAFAQLGVPVALVGVAGADEAGALVIDDAATSGIDVGAVVRRGETALLVDLVEHDGTRRLVEDVPDAALLTPEDVAAAGARFAAADTVCLQLQQPPEALLAAAGLAEQGGAAIVLDGALEDAEAWDRLVGAATVVRADATEAAMIAGHALDGPDEARRAAEALLERGPEVVAFEVAGTGNLVAWWGGARLLPLASGPIADPTGGGDAVLAGLVTALRRGADPADAGAFAADAAAATVHRLGGRPDLTSLRDRLPGR